MTRSQSVNSEGSEGLGAIHLTPNRKAETHSPRRSPGSDEVPDEDGNRKERVAQLNISARHRNSRLSSRGEVAQLRTSNSVASSGTRVLRPRKATPHRILSHVQPPVLTSAAKARYGTLGDIPPLPPRLIAPKAYTKSPPVSERGPKVASRSPSSSSGVVLKSTRGSTKRKARTQRLAKDSPKRVKDFSKRARDSFKHVKSKLDPDDDEEEADTEEETDMIAGLEMDEPERFKSASRLRKRQESAYQRKLRKLKNHRLGIIESSTSEEDDDSEGSNTSASDSGFVTSDGESLDESILPAQFSLNAAQTPEFKFKVVFQYFVALVIRGPKSLPLEGEEARYFLPQLHDLRHRMSGFKSSVRSQIWKVDLVRALETFPHFQVTPLGEISSYCDACNRHNQRCRVSVTLTGDAYSKDTHEALNDSDSDCESEAVEQYNMGPHCRERAERFHQLSHWEDVLFHRIRKHYRDLLRAKHKPVPDDSEASTSSSPDSDSDPEDRLRRIKIRQQRRARTRQRIQKLRQTGTLPDNYRNIDRVTEWMDEMGYQRKNFRWLKDLEDLSTLGNSTID